MKMRAQSILFVSAAAAAFSVNAFATGYGGAPIGVNFPELPPAMYAECTTDLYSGHVKIKDACYFGLDEARRIAEYYGGAHGKVEGFLRGYAWGLREGARAKSNDATAYAQGQAMVAGMGDTMASGLAAGIQAGREDGLAAARKDALARVMTAMEQSGSTPNWSLNYPAISYQGETDGYARLVGPLLDEKSMLKKEMAEVANITIYENLPSHIDDVTAYHGWDMWYGDGIYPFERERYYQSEAAFNYWVKVIALLDTSMQTKPKYDALNVNAPELTPGTPVDLKAYFKQAFVKSYPVYVHYNFGKAFKENLDTGALAGTRVGEQLGLRIATQAGTVAEFNRKFAESSKLTHDDAFRSAYKAEFESLQADYMSPTDLNKHLVIALEEVVETNSDGALSPGENVRVRFRAENYSGVTIPLSVTLSGDVEESVTQSLSIGRFSRGEFTTGVMGKIRSSMHTGQVGRFYLTVNGRASNDLNEDVHYSVEVDQTLARVTTYTTEGRAEVRASISNVTEKATQGSIKVILTVDGRTVDTYPVGPMAAGDRRDVVLAIRNIDPLKLLSPGIDGQVVVVMDKGGSEMVLDDRTDAKIVSKDPKTDMARYFSQLIQGKGYLAPGTDRETQISAVAAHIVATDNAETRSYRNQGANVWKENLPSTTVGAVAHERAQANPSDAEIMARYDRLARELWPHRMNLKGKFLGLFGGGKRKAYSEAVQALATGKLK